MILSQSLATSLLPAFSHLLNSILAGQDGIKEGFGENIRQHFNGKPFAKVLLGQRPRGITVKQCIVELEVRLSGS